MNELVRWETDRGPVVVEVDDDQPGFESVSRTGDLVLSAGEHLETALGTVRAAAESALASLAGLAKAPDVVELEFGVKLNAAAGAVIAKTSLEGHLKVKLTWGSPEGADEEE
ncbi:CU044_2847 family protein [Actinomadura atramentaria]|uniref:CU044_2847 family protein n=1 Tax=Actinomadura atramentaria TaxID=1990 RepID=UPI0003A3446B|nr:CU044_2847 family protein [Actinomadura atramentaria]